MQIYFGIFPWCPDLAGGFLVAACWSSLPPFANTDPPQWEKTFARLALNGYVARHAPRLTNPISATDENLLAGMNVFRDACAGCHGDPNGISQYGQGFYPRVPQFAIDPPRRPDWQLFGSSRTACVTPGCLPGTGSGTTIKQVSDNRMSFLSRLDSLPPKVNAEWHKKPQGS